MLRSILVAPAKRLPVFPAALDVGQQHQELSGFPFSLERVREGLPLNCAKILVYETGRTLFDPHRLNEAGDKLGLVETPTVEVRGSFPLDPASGLPVDSAPAEIPSARRG